MVCFFHYLYIIINVFVIYNYQHNQHIFLLTVLYIFYVLIDLRYRDLNLVKTLIKRGANVNLKNRFVEEEEYVPPLYYATAVQDAEIVEHLLKSGKAYNLSNEKKYDFKKFYLYMFYVELLKVFLKQRYQCTIEQNNPYQINQFKRNILSQCFHKKVSPLSSMQFN